MNNHQSNKITRTCKMFRKAAKRCKINLVMGGKKLQKETEIVTDVYGKVQK